MASKWCLCEVVVAVIVPLLWSAGAFKMTIMHTNDVHARFDQTNSRSGECSSSDAAEDKCFGGFPRLYSKVKEIRANHSNVVLVDAGDQFQGTIWFYAYGSNITSHFMNQMGYDIMSLGNHEFDLGPSEAEKMVGKASFPVLSSNTDASAYPGLHSLLKRHAILQIGDQRVGFVGYTTVNTAVISKPEKVTFSDEVEAVRREVANLTGQGVNKIVCVGHAGFVKDLSIAREVVGVDVVVGGHTNTFLYTGSPPSIEDPVGDYPQVITRSDGSRALVVQDYAYGKYLGFLQVEFDDQGQVTSWSGNPILMNSSVPRDQGMLSELEKWRSGMVALSNQSVGHTAALLVGESTVCRLRECNMVGRTAALLVGERTVCRLRECNMGNVIADAMVVQNLRHSDSMEWNHVAIAIVNSGGIRSTLSKGDITVADVLMVQPFRSTIDIVEVKGSALVSIMEHSASQWDPADLNGGFLQHSGLEVEYDMSRPVGSRVVDMKVRCADCEVPQFEAVDPSKVYKVILPNFLALGGDGYKVITDNTLKHHLNGDLDSDVLTEYIKKFSPLIQGLEGQDPLLQPQRYRGSLHFWQCYFQSDVTVCAGPLCRRHRQSSLPSPLVAFC
ncbi:hypothetical protein ACOMHN_043086 [Nucella lapillus]